MLKDEALDFYFANQARYQQIATLEQMCESFKLNFEGPEHRINLLQKWNAMSLAGTMRINEGKSLTECLDLLI